MHLSINPYELVVALAAFFSLVFFLGQRTFRNASSLATQQNFKDLAEALSLRNEELKEQLTELHHRLEVSALKLDEQQKQIDHLTELVSSRAAVDELITKVDTVLEGVHAIQQVVLK